MAGLANLKLPSHKVKVGNSELEFFGLSFIMIVGLIKNYKTELDKLLEMATNLSPDDDLSDVIVGAIQEMPELAAAIIAVSAKEPDQVESASSLPFPLQVEIIEQIYELTLKEVGGMGKFLNVVIRIFQKTNSAMENLPELKASIGS